MNKAGTTTSVSTACMTTFVENQPFTFAAAVTGASAGTVTFTRSGPVTMCTQPLSAGTASRTVSTLAHIGADTTDVYNLTASYGGDANHASSASGAFAVTVLNAGDVVSRNGFETDSASCPIE